MHNTDNAPPDSIAGPLRARAQVEDLFGAPAKAAGKFLDEPVKFIAKLKAENDPSVIGRELPKLRTLKEALTAVGGGASMDLAARMAWEAFHLLFRCDGRPGELQAFVRLLSRSLFN